MICTSDKQAKYLIDMEIAKSSAKSRVLDSTSDVKDISKLSSMVLTRDETTGEQGFQIEILQSQSKDKDGNPRFQSYCITDKQLDAMWENGNTSYKSKLYDMLSSYDESGDVNVRYGSDSLARRWEPYDGRIFSPMDKPAAMLSSSLSEQFKSYESDVEAAHEKNKAAYYEEHKPIRIGYTLSKNSLPNPVRVRDDWDVDEIGKATGIYPVDKEGNPPDPNSSEDKFYNVGYKFVPVLACDKMPMSEARKNPIPNPYLVRYYGKLDAGAPAREYHDELIDPSYATALMKSSNFEKSPDGKLIVGVTNTTVYDHDHDYTHRYTDSSNKYINVKDIKGQYTNEVLSEPERPAVSEEMIRTTKPPKGCVRTVNIVGDLPDGIRSIPSEPFDFQAHKRFVAVSVDQVKKENEAKLQNSIKKATSLGSSISSEETAEKVPEA